MAKDKKSVLLYCDIIHTVEKLDDKTAGELFKHYLRYVNDENPETDNEIVDIVFEPIKQQLKRDLKSYESKCSKNRDNANKRWNKNNANASDRINRNANHADKDTDKDTDINKEAYTFLKDKNKSDIEAFEMQNKRSFKNYESFITNFNCKCVEEKLEFEPKLLFARLQRMNSNWDKTQKPEKPTRSMIL